jgi:hypothetical protein
MGDLLFSDLDPAVVEVIPLRSMVMEDLEYVHLVKNWLGAFQGETASLKLRDELQSELPEMLLVLGDSNVLGVSDLGLSNTDPVVVEGSPRLLAEVVEGLKDVHLVEDPLDFLHVGTASLKHGGVMKSELGESSLVSDDSLGPDVVDLSLADPNPVPVEGKPLSGGEMIPNFLDLHLVKSILGAFHAGATTLEFGHKLVSELDEESKLILVFLGVLLEDGGLDDLFDETLLVLSTF